MTWILKLFGITVLFIISSFLLKESGSNFSSTLSSVVIAVIFLLLTDRLSYIIEYLISLSQETVIGDRLFVIMKAGAIAVLTDLAADLCRSSGEDTVSKYIEFAGRIEIIYISLPLVQELLSLSLSLL